MLAGKNLAARKGRYFEDRFEPESGGDVDLLGLFLWFPRFLARRVVNAQGSLPLLIQCRL
jgi:hypothetical protein